MPWSSKVLREALNLKEVCRSELSAVLGLDLQDCDASRVEMSPSASVRCLTRTIQARLLPVEDLREQMIVAQEVKAPTGDVLAGLTTTLTASAIGRLQSVLRSARLVRAMNSAMNTPISTKLP